MKFLIIRLGSLGDIVLTTPVIKVLKERYPDAVVDFLAKKEYHDLLSANPYLNKIIPLDSKGMHKGLTGLLEISKELRVGGYTHVIDLHGNLRSRMITSLLPGAKTLRYDKQAIKRRLLLSGFKVKTRHTVAAYLEALAPLHLDIPSLSETGLRGGILKLLPKIYLSQEEEKAAQYFLAQHGVSDETHISLRRTREHENQPHPHLSPLPEGEETILLPPLQGEGWGGDGVFSVQIPLIGIAPGARWPTKRWTEDGFIEVGRKAGKEFGARVLIFGGPDEVDLSKRVAAGIGDKAFSVVGLVGLKETAALIKRCKVFISNDSGPMHIATAVGTPVVAIFGPTVQGFGFSPLGNGVVVEKELECRPCSLHGSNNCPKRHFECMKGIKADEVFEKVKELLNHEGTKNTRDTK